jgi:hypothetical protein
LRFEPGGAVTSTKASTRLPGASTIAPLRARNGSAGWLSIAMTVTSTDSSLQRDDSAPAAVDEAKSQALIGSG